jgi:hypothetical protein
MYDQIRLSLFSIYFISLILFLVFSSSLTRAGYHTAVLKSQSPLGLHTQALTARLKISESQDGRRPRFSCSSHFGFRLPLVWAQWANNNTLGVLTVSEFDFQHTVAFRYTGLGNRWRAYRVADHSAALGAFRQMFPE